jgi:hypothetical protein
VKVFVQFSHVPLKFVVYDHGRNFFSGGSQVLVIGGLQGALLLAMRGGGGNELLWAASETKVVGWVWVGGVFDLMTAGSSAVSAISVISFASIRSTGGPEEIDCFLPLVLRVLEPW